jgi:cytidine deaminase
MNQSFETFASLFVTDNCQSLLTVPDGSSTYDLPTVPVSPPEDPKTALQTYTNDAFSSDLKVIELINARVEKGPDGTQRLHLIFAGDLSTEIKDWQPPAEYVWTPLETLNNQELLAPLKSKLAIQTKNNRVVPETSNHQLIELARIAATQSVKLPSNQPRDARTLIGAAVLTINGQTHTGSIIETRDKIQTVHAEQLAISKAVAHNHEPIKKLAVYSSDGGIWPCGACLQFLYEFSEDGDPRILVKSDSEPAKTRSLSDLYSHPWPPDLHPRES